MAGYVYRVTARKGDEYVFPAPDEGLAADQALFSARQAIGKNRYANLCNHINLRAGRRRFTWVYLLLSVLSLVGFTADVLARSAMGWGLGIDSYILLAVLAAMYVKSMFHPLFDLGRYKRRWDAHPLLRDGYTVQVHKTGLLLENPENPQAGRVWLAYSEVEALYPLSDVLLFVVRPATALFVPLSREDLPTAVQEYLLELPIKKID